MSSSTEITMETINNILTKINETTSLERKTAIEQAANELYRNFLDFTRTQPNTTLRNLLVQLGKIYGDYPADRDRIKGFEDDFYDFINTVLNETERIRAEEFLFSRAFPEDPDLGIPKIQSRIFTVIAKFLPGNEEYISGEGDKTIYLDATDKLTTPKKGVSFGSHLTSSSSSSKSTGMSGATPFLGGEGSPSPLTNPNTVAIDQLVQLIGAYIKQNTKSLTSNKQPKEIHLPTFKGKVEDVLSFISSVETTYRANGWKDDRNDPETFEDNEVYTPEEVFGNAHATVNRIAQYLEGPAALWWQNLAKRPLTWHDTPDILQQTARFNRPGWPRIYADHGLRSLLKNTFLSKTHIQDAKRKLEKMKFNPNGHEGIEEFAAEMNSKLTIIGMAYDDDNPVTCGLRADYLLRSMPDWISTKVMEKMSPCHHEQWCFGQVTADIRRILSARSDKQDRPPKDHNKGKQTFQKSAYNNNNNRSESKKTFKK